MFDGAKEDPYVETDQTNPINASGHAKLAGEQAVGKVEVYHRRRAGCSRTVRTLNTWFSWECDELKVVDDQFGGQQVLIVF